MARLLHGAGGCSDDFLKAAVEGRLVSSRNTNPIRGRILAVDKTVKRFGKEAWAEKMEYEGDRRENRASSETSPK